MDSHDSAPFVGDALAVTGQDAIATRDQARSVRVEAARKVAELEALKRSQLEEVRKAREEIEARFARMRDEIEAKAAPLRQQLAQVTEVLWTVDLYLGRDEAITQFREGKPAPADTPITIRQRVLSMAEESLIHLDASGGRGMGAAQIDAFLEWVAATEENLNKILPEQKGVVVLVPTRVTDDSRNHFEKAARDQENSQAYWIIRNGENLYALTTDENLRITDRLLPRRDEFTSVFEERLFGFRDRGPVEPGSDEWMYMEKRASSLQRHYMRVLLVLQGLIDRTTVWHPLPEHGVSLLNLKDQDRGKIVLLQDEDPSMQLGDGRESFRDFRNRLNARLRPGLRVIISTGSDAFTKLADDYFRHPRIHPATAEKPSPLTPYVIEGRKDGGLVIRYNRTDEVLKRNVPVPDRPGYVYPEQYGPPSRRASLLFHPEDSWVLPMDLASTEELRYYLNSRDARSTDLLDMVPLIKAALEVKESEALAEKPFRDLLDGQLGAEGLDVDVDALIHAWKVRRTYTRPLNGDQEHEAKAVREILHEARMVQLSRDEAATMVPKGRKVPGAVAVALHALATPRWVALVPTAPGSMFYDVHPLNARKDGTGPVEREVFMGHLFTSRLISAWHSDEWNAVLASPLQQSQVLSPTQAQQALAAALALADGEPLAVTVRFDPRSPSQGWLYRVLWINESEQERRTDGPFKFRSLRVAINRNRTLAFTEERTRYLGHQYSDPTFKMSVPWAGEGHGRYRDVRDRLVWSDEGQMGRARDIEGELAQEQAKASAERSKMWEVSSRWIDAIAAQVQTELERREHERFLEDFGPGQQDLWPGHLKSRTGSRAMRSPWKYGNSLNEAVRNRVKAGLPLAGITLLELLGEKELEREDFAGFVVAAVEPSGEG